VSVANPKITVRKVGVEAAVAAPMQGEGVKQERKDVLVVVKWGDVRKMTVGSVVVPVVGVGTNKKVWVGEEAGAVLGLEREKEKHVTEKKKMVAGGVGIKGKPQ